jgi:hypothetical protein
MRSPAAAAGGDETNRASAAAVGDQTRENVQPLRNVFQHRAPVHEIERGLLERVGDDVVGEHLQVLQAVSVDEPRIEIGCQHASRAADPLGQPSRDAAGTATHLEAPPPLADTEVGQQPP